MLVITGKVLKKEKKKSQNKAEIILQDDFNNMHSFQVRPNRLHTLVEVDTNQRVKIFYKTDLAERFDTTKKEHKRVTYLILESIEVLDGSS
jgi:hypothetical protein